jgi:putative dimethyl sulfoxide reductase chaperone
VSATLQSPAASKRARDVALCRSILYEALALGFRAPTDRTLERLVAADAVAALAEAGAFLDEETAGVAVERGSGLAGRVRALAAPPRPAAPGSLSKRHLDLFGHTVRGPIPAYETEYGEDTLFQKPQEMSDIAGFLAAFGLVLNPHSHERIDHIACELEFAAFLARKEAHALETGNEPMSEETRRATRLFLKDHLARFVPSFGRRVVAADPAGFYGRLARLCLDFVKAECGRYEAPWGPEMLRLRTPIDDGAPMACGSPDGCGVPGPCGHDSKIDGGPGLHGNGNT